MSLQNNSEITWKHLLQLPKKWRRAIGLILLAVAIVLIFRDLKVYVPQIPDLIKEADDILILVILGLQILSYAASAGTTHFLLALRHKKIKFLDNMRVSISAEFGGRLVPLAGGPIASYVAFRKLGLEAELAHYAVAVESFFLSIDYVFFFLLSLILPPYPRIGLENFTLPRLVLLILVGVALITAVAYLARRKIMSFLNTTHDAIRSLGRHKLIGSAILFFTSLYFLLDIAMLEVAFRTFGSFAPLSVVIFGFLSASALVLVTTTGTIPGIPEASLSIVFIKLGIPAHIAISGVLLYRLLSYWLWLPLSILYSYRFLKPEG